MGRLPMTGRTPIEQLPPAERAAVLRPLLHDLAERGLAAASDWPDWVIVAVHGGWNGLIYHATGPSGDLAIKLTPRDDRQRAEREYQALLAMQEAGLSVAPYPVLVIPDHHKLAVVVQSWLVGAVTAAPPADDEEWLHLLKHLVQVHSVTPSRIGVRLRQAVLTSESPAASRRLVFEQASRIPEEHQPAEARALLRRFEAACQPDRRPAGPVLCRCDANTLNYIRRPGAWASVDWENSGWGDPAFEIAELTTHPAFAEVNTERWEWVVNAYARLVGDSAIDLRIRAYSEVLAVWWVFRVLRYLYDNQRGADQRLAQRPPDWCGLVAQYERYLALAQKFYSST
jgi:aminoglycoside phosphotransferase (APT) family kinase protein